MLYTFNPKNTYYPRAHNGVVETLNNFNRQGYKLGIISSSSKFKLNQTYNRLFSTNIHSFIYGYEDLKFFKPDPKLFYKPLKYLDLNKNQVIYIGDSLLDYFAARDAGIVFYAVTTGITSGKNFIEAGLNAENILDSFSSIYDLLQTLNRCKI